MRPQNMAPEVAEARDAFFEHLAVCHACKLMPSSQNDTTCAFGKPLYTEAQRLLKGVVR